MKLLLITATYPPTHCGVGDHTRRLAQELSQQGEQVSVLTAAGLDPDHQHREPDDLGPVGEAPILGGVRLGPPEFDGSIEVWRAVGDWGWPARDWFDAALTQISPDVVNLHYHGEDYGLHPSVCTFAEIAARRGIPTVTALHNLQKPRGWTGGHAPLEDLLEHSCRWITTNELDRVELSRLGGAEEKLSLITAGPNIAGGGARGATGSGPLRLAYFGFLNPAKGLEFLVAALEQAMRRGVSLQLDFAAGTHTDATSRLRDYASFVDGEIQRRGVAGVLQRRGYLAEDQVRLLLLECELAVFPFREGLSGKNGSLLSAMDHATPVLTTRGPGTPDGLVDGDNVLLANPRDIGSLADKIEWAAGHRDQLAAIGEAGRAFVRSRFDWSQLAAEHRELFQSCPQRKEGSAS